MNKRNFLKQFSLLISFFSVKNILANDSESPSNSNRPSSTCTGGECPGFEDCQGFVPPCSECEDPRAWRERASARLENSYQGFWAVPRLRWCNFFGRK